MKIALIGYGKMGKFIEQIAIARGHEIVSIIDVENHDDIYGDKFKTADVAIEFSRPDCAVNNIKACFKAGVPVVCGTTGWTSEIESVKKDLEAADGTLFWSSNYSLGVNIFMAVNKYLAHIMNQFDNYNVDITEIHHIHKLDAPSGTAITLAEGVIGELNRKTGWSKEIENTPDDIAIKSIREGEVPGTHTIHYDSDVDSITITHEAKSRKGLALGAVLSAEFLKGKKGFYGMNDMFKF